MLSRVSVSALFFLFSSGMGHALLEFANRIKLTDPISKIEFSEIVDMDGDGDIDIFTATDFGFQVNWWQNDGLGNFTRQNWRTPNLLKPNVFGIGDWNGDGRQDLWLEDRDDDPTEYGKTTVTYRIALGGVGGGFSVPSVVAAIPDDEGSYMTPLLADLDGNGRKDIVSRGLVFMAGDNGTYLLPVALPPSLRWDVREEIIFADYDGDGDRDILKKTNGAGDLYKSENLGNGMFAEAEALIDLQPNKVINGITFIDLDESSIQPNLFLITEDIQASTQKLLAYRCRSDGTLVESVGIDLPSRDGDAYITWENLQTDDGSGRLFIARVTYLPTMRKFETELFELIHGNGILLIQPRSKHKDMVRFSASAVRDLDADGNSDLVLPIASIPGTSGTAADHVTWLKGDASGVFTTPARLVIPSFNERFLVSIRDLDGDGDADILLGSELPLGGSSEAGAISLWMNRGDGIGFDKQIIVANCIQARVIAIDDFSNDNTSYHSAVPSLTFPIQSGRQNLIIESSRINPYNGSIYRLVSIAYQGSDGRFESASAYTIPTDSIAFYEDWDRDGMKDLIFRDLHGNIWWMKRNHGIFSESKLIMTLPSGDFHDPGAFGFIDMDLDGDLDIFARGNLFGAATSYWVERDDEGNILSIRLLPRGLRLLGFDADGDGDMDFTNDLGDVLALGSGVTFVSIPISFPDRNGRLFDLDGDGDLDRVISAPTDGTLGFQRLFWSENDGTNSQQGFGAELPIDNGVEFAQRDQFALGDMDGDGTKDLLVVSSDTALVEWFKITNQRGPNAFQIWMMAQDLTGSSAGPRGDWDKDGRSNWEEFLYGTFAKMPDSGARALPKMENVGRGMEFVFTRRKSVSGLTLSYPLQRSKTLNHDWQPWIPATQRLVSLGDYEEVRIPVTISQKAEFFRIQLPEIPE